MVRRTAYALYAALLGRPDLVSTTAIQNKLNASPQVFLEGGHTAAATCILQAWHPSPLAPTEP